MDKEIEKLFEECHSNLDTPLAGQVYSPLCCTCQNFVDPYDPFESPRCNAYGKLPRDIYLSNGAPCEHYIVKKQ